LLPTQAMAFSSHHYRAASYTFPFLTLPCSTLLRIPPLLLLPSVLVLPVFHLWFTSLSSMFTPQMMSSILMSSIDTDMLVILKHISPATISLQILDLYYHPLDITMDIPIWTQLISRIKCVPPEFQLWLFLSHST